MPKRLRRLVAIPILAVALLASGPAMAQFDLEPTQDTILGTVTSIEGTLVSILNQLTDPAMPGSLPMIESAITAAGASASQASNVHLHGAASINDVHDTHEWSLTSAEQQGEAQNHAQATYAGCQTASAAMASTANFYPDRVSASNQVLGALNQAGNSSGQNSQYGTFARFAKDAAYEIKQYANSSELCPSGATGCSVSNGPMPDADVNAFTLLGMDTFVSGIPVGSQINATAMGPAPSWDAAAKDYCNKLTNPSSLDPLQNSLLGSPEGITEFSLRKAGDARMSLSALVCAEMVAEREPVTNSSNTWGQKIMNNLISTYNLPSSGIATQNFSSYQLMKLEAHDQFADPNWIQMVSSESSSSAVLRLLNTMEASSLQMQWKEYQSLERIKLLEAVSLAAETEKTRVNTPATALPAN